MPPVHYSELMANTCCALDDGLNRPCSDMPMVVSEEEIGDVDTLPEDPVSTMVKNEFKLALGRKRLNTRRRFSLAVAGAAELPRHMQYWEKMKQENKVDWSKRYTDLPCDRLCLLKKPISVATSGPGDGITTTLLDQKHMETFKPTELAGSRSSHMISEWTKRHHRAYGIATSLYECDPLNNTCTGDPIADVFAIVARPNNCIMSLADGVNWGEKSRLAARCAVAGSVQYLKQYLSTAVTTHQVMYLLLKSFEFAQSCIIKSSATMTTLCTAAVVELEGTDQWGLCVLNVGDSLAFVYNQEDGVREITIGSHCEERDMRCPGGSLGPVDGYNPDLENLTFSFTKVSPGDIVFLTSDGVSDNFDPVVSHCGHCQGSLKPSLSADSLIELYHQSSANSKTEKREKTVTSRTKHEYSAWDVPPVRLSKTLHDMTQAIEVESPEDQLSARELCAKLLSHVCKCTNEKRTFFEQVNSQGQVKNGKMRRAKDKEVSRRIRQFPGKLDHASVVAYEVGDFPVEPFRLVSRGPAEVGRSRGLVDRLQTTFREFTRPNGYDLTNDDETTFTELYSLLTPT